MPFEYEVLVGYLYVVGGRSISAPPPGTLVEINSRKVGRARELDTFFTLVIPSGDTVAQATFYEEMARTGAEQYFNSTGSVTAGIKTVFTHLNTHLFEHNASDPRHYEASMLCGVLRGSDLYVGKVGAGVGLFRHDGDTQPFPTDFSYPEALKTAALGVALEAEVRMGRYQVSAGTRLLLSDTALLDYPIELLTSTLGLEDIGSVLATLREHTKRQITAMAIEFVSPDQPTAPSVRTGESSAVITGNAPAPVASSASAAAPVATTGEMRRSPRRGSFLPGILARLASFGAGAVDLVLHLLDRLIPTPPDGKKGWLSSPIAAAVALLIPVLIVVLVVMLWINQTGVTEFDECINRASTTTTTARSIASSDMSGTMAAWNAVLAVSDECDQIRLDPSIAAMRTEARGVLDRLQNVSRRGTSVIYQFPSASLTQAVLQGEDMYVLDSANEQVYRITLTANGMGVAEGSYTPIPAMRRNGRVINFDVANLIDIAWADNGAGLSQSNVITALDQNGILIACPPRFLQDCSAQQLPNRETWNHPIAIQFWEGRLYLLDPSANQIWRYDPSGGAFAGVPLEYFTGSNRPDITTAIDFAITTAGDLYLLTSGGVVARFRGGEQQDFAFTWPDGQGLSAPNGMYLNTNPIAQGLYFAERGQRAIIETTMAGTFINAYRAGTDEEFAQLSNVIADTNQGVVYALSGNSLLAFPRAQQ
ncbi:MAG: hypothetical protein ABI835_13570 [Chloroflexota bacterium]